MVFQIGIGIAIAISISDENRDRDRDLDFGDRGHVLVKRGRVGGILIQRESVYSGQKMAL